MSRKQQDSASLIEADKRAVVKGHKVGTVPLARTEMPTSFSDAQPKAFNDPGGKTPGPSIKCPDIYEALRKKGMSKEKAARISNSRCNE